MVRNIQVVHQTGGMLGDIDLYIGEKAVRCVARRGEIVIVSSAPTWKVLLYSKPRNEGFELTNKQAGFSRLGIMGLPGDVDKGEVTRVFDAKLKCKCTQVFVDGTKQPSQTKDLYIFQERNHRRLKNYTYRLADIGTLTPEVQNVLFWLYSDHFFKGVPVEAIINYADGSKVTLYSTVSRSTTSKPASFFDYPKGYKLNRDKMKVLTSADMNTTLEDLWVPGKD